LLKFPGFSALAIVTLALGIGASTAMFSVINKVLFVRLPFKDSPRVVYVGQKQANGVANVFSLPDFLERKRQSRLLQHMAAFGPASFTLGAGDQPERISGAKFSYDMFYALGVVPAITQIPKSVILITENSMTVVLRTSGVAGLSESIRRAVASVDNTVAVYQVQTAEQMIADSGSLRRFDMWLIGVFAAMALVLAAVGVYGVMAYAVSQRTREIGILIALGAQRRDVLRMVMQQGARMALIGVGAGVGGALVLTRVMKSLLYEVSPTDLPTFGVVALIVLALLLAACLVPSLRATRIDPIVALRCE
jgi:hypothetical protein